MNEKIEALARAVDASLQQTNVLFSMLIDEMYPPEEIVRTPQVDTTPPPHQPYASDDPIRCEHPDRMEVMGQELCNSCGSNLSG